VAGEEEADPDELQENLILWWLQKDFELEFWAVIGRCKAHVYPL
jgi:hypothetical protein